MTGPELRARREALGLTYRDAAQRLGVNLSTLYRWESGKRAIPAMLDRALRDIEREQATDR